MENLTGFQRVTLPSFVCDEINRLGPFWHQQRISFGPDDSVGSGPLFNKRGRINKTDLRDFLNDPVSGRWTVIRI
jgi:hypothetical protein